ncbi:hypothetical protein [Alkaliphilus hydrothermalis]|uniref:Uncharacterized protein n=1 Tax=Alkaliphilus hydrothermalis TaxID=1482730 RepID=A0ABS2NRX4_9FIRM|nr:hypothetical protein [Alkaliphilus hydrothermalis]MBM7615724.1 hypothetical protein [Alkaliphilus hydrothermalis]
MGATTEKGKLVSGISMLLYILVLTLKNLPIERGLVAPIVAGISMVLGAIFFKKELCMLWGVSTWVYGVAFLVLALLKILS